jgi:hypothetical protein
LWNFLIDIYFPFYESFRIFIKLFQKTDTFNKFCSDIEHFKKQPGTLTKSDYNIWINSIYNLYYKFPMDVWRVKYNLMIPNTEIFNDLLKGYPKTVSDLHFQHVKSFYNIHKDNPNAYVRWGCNPPKKHICNYDENLYYQSITFLKNNYCILIFGCLIISSGFFYKLN